MNRDRILAMMLFSISASIVWIVFLVIAEGTLRFNLYTIGGFGAAVAAACINSFWFATKIIEKKVLYAAFWGFIITLLSFLLGSVLFGIGFAIHDHFFGPHEIFTIETIADIFRYMLGAFMISVTLMSPGFLMGAGTGVIYLKLIQRKEIGFLNT